MSSSLTILGANMPPNSQGSGTLEFSTRAPPRKCLHLVGPDHSEHLKLKKARLPWIGLLKQTSFLWAYCFGPFLQIKTSSTLLIFPSTNNFVTTTLWTS